LTLPPALPALGSPETEQADRRLDRECFPWRCETSRLREVHRCRSSSVARARSWSASAYVPVTSRAHRDPRGRLRMVEILSALVMSVSVTGMWKTCW